MVFSADFEIISRTTPYYYIYYTPCGSQYLSTQQCSYPSQYHSAHDNIYNGVACDSSCGQYPCDHSHHFHVDGVTPTVIALGSPLAIGPPNSSATNATVTPNPQWLGSNKDAAGRSIDTEKPKSRVSPSLRDDRQNITGAKDNAQLKKMWPVVRERRSVLPLHIPFGVLMDFGRG